MKGCFSIPGLPDARRKQIYDRVHLLISQSHPLDSNEEHLVSWVIRLQDLALSLIERINDLGGEYCSDDVAAVLLNETKNPS